MSNYSDEDWEALAREWRKDARMDESARIDARAFVRHLKHRGHIADYVRVPDAELRHEGKYEPSERIIYVRQSVWTAAESDVPRAVWTLIHEASHAILNHSETRLRSSAPTRSRRAAFDEIDANRFTAALVAPFDKANFKPGTSVDDLVSRFGLSKAAAEKRLAEFDRIYRKRHGIKRNLPPGIVDFLVEQKRKGHTVTSLPDDMPSPAKANKRYEGELCSNCGNFAMVRVGLVMKCDCCGARTGDD